MKTIRALAAWGLNGLWLLAATAAAGALEDHERIRGGVEAHALAAARTFAPTGATVRAHVARLDPRLRLAACPVPPETFDSPGQRPGAHVNVGVRCPAAPGWSLYVPVRVEMIAEVVVLASAVARGETLRPEALRLEPRDLAQLGAGYLTRLDEAEGMVLRRPVTPGTALGPALIERPKLVRRGQRVRLMAGGGPFAVASEGEALADAAEGERVRVRNVHSRQIVEGVVTTDGTIWTGG